MGQVANSVKPGWYKRSGVLAEDMGDRQTGWYLPYVSATGRPTTGVNRPGWYLEIGIPKQDRTMDVRSANKMMEGYSIASARNAAKPNTMPQLMSDESIYLEDLQNETQTRARTLLSQESRAHMRPKFTARHSSAPAGSSITQANSLTRSLSGSRTGSGRSGMTSGGSSAGSSRSSRRPR